MSDGYGYHGNKRLLALEGALGICFSTAEFSFLLLSLLLLFSHLQATRNTPSSYILRRFFSFNKLRLGGGVKKGAFEILSAYSSYLI